jgi:hypothetical protein
MATHGVVDDDGATEARADITSPAGFTVLYVVNMGYQA